MKKRALRTIRLVLVLVLLTVSLVAGILLYRVFLGYYPGVNLADLFAARVGMPPFPFIGITAGILISIPVIIAAFEIYFRFSSSYVNFISENGFIHLSDAAITGFIRDSVSETKGVETAEVRVAIFKENKIGVHIWIDTDDKSDFVSFSQKVQQRVTHELDYHFGINKIRFFHVYVESTNIGGGGGTGAGPGAGGTGYKVKYR